MTTVLYVLGAPGVGKTALCRSMLGLNPDGTVRGINHVRLHPKPKWTEVLTTEEHLCAAGHYTGKPFDGGDTVPYTGASEALGYWVKHLMVPCGLTILDGDRFSTSPSLAFLQTHRPLLTRQVQVLGVHLVASPETLAARRAQRRDVTGAIQNETWVKGRVTKARNFAQRINALELDANEPAVAMHLRVSRFLEKLKGVT